MYQQKRTLLHKQIRRHHIKEMIQERRKQSQCNPEVDRQFLRIIQQNVQQINEELLSNFDEIRVDLLFSNKDYLSRLKETHLANIKWSVQIGKKYHIFSQQFFNKTLDISMENIHVGDKQQKVNALLEYWLQYLSFQKIFQQKPIQILYRNTLKIYREEKCKYNHNILYKLIAKLYSYFANERLICQIAVELPQKEINEGGLQLLIIILQNFPVEIISRKQLLNWAVSSLFNSQKRIILEGLYFLNILLLNNNLQVYFSIEMVMKIVKQLYKIYEQNGKQQQLVLILLYNISFQRSQVLQNLYELLDVDGFLSRLKPINQLNGYMHLIKIIQNQWSYSVFQKYVVKSQLMNRILQQCQNSPHDSLFSQLVHAIYVNTDNQTSLNKQIYLRLVDISNKIQIDETTHQQLLEMQNYVDT